MGKRDVVSLVIMAVLCVLSMANIIWMVMINHPDMAMGSAVMFAVFAFVFMYSFNDKEK
jgi:hypothetical protein